MTLLGSLPHLLDRLVTPMTWIQATDIVERAFAPLRGLLDIMFMFVGRLLETPFIGPALTTPVVGVGIVASIVLAIVAGLLVYLLLLGSAIVSGSIAILVGSATDVLGAVEHLIRIVRGI
jgi:hypothetical protein